MNPILKKYLREEDEKHSFCKIALLRLLGIFAFFEIKDSMTADKAIFFIRFLIKL